MQNKYTIQDIFKIYGDAFIEKYNLSKEQWQVFNAIRNCKTKEIKSARSKDGRKNNNRRCYFPYIMANRKTNRRKSIK